MGSPYAPAHYLAYYDTFEFSDRAGQTKTGHGEVSAAFYAAHPVGAIVPAYYYPGQADRAVLGTPMGLGPQGVLHQLEIGALLALLGGLFLAINAKPALAALRAARGAQQQHRR
jgi:hypothetical protein